MEFLSECHKRSKQTHTPTTTADSAQQLLKYAKTKLKLSLPCDVYSLLRIRPAGFHLLSFLALPVLCVYLSLYAHHLSSS